MFHLHLVLLILCIQFGHLLLISQRAHSMLHLRTALDSLSAELIFHLILSLLLECLPAFDFVDGLHFQHLLLLLIGLNLLFELVYYLQDSHFTLACWFDLATLAGLILFEIHLTSCAKVIQILLDVLKECFLSDAYVPHIVH